MSLLDPVCAFCLGGGSDFPPDTITLSIPTDLPVAPDSFCCSLSFLSIHTFPATSWMKKKDLRAKVGEGVEMKTPTNINISVHFIITILEGRAHKREN